VAADERSSLGAGGRTPMRGTPALGPRAPITVVRAVAPQASQGIVSTRKPLAAATSSASTAAKPAIVPTRLAGATVTQHPAPTPKDQGSTARPPIARPTLARPTSVTSSAVPVVAAKLDRPASAPSPAATAVAPQPTRQLEVDTVTYAAFIKKVLAVSAIDLSGYKVPQMLRRLTPLLGKSGAKDLPSYAKLLASDPAELKRFKDSFTINVSEFFRDTDRFDDLAGKILPRLLSQRRQLRLWSAGCSIGAEPYSFAMILSTLPAAAGHRLLATDIDATTLDHAKAGGPYRPQDLRNVTPRLAADFVETRDGSCWVSDRLRSRVDFRVHDLLRDPFEPNQDLIACRNVVIYFTEDAKARLYQRFHDALRTGGILFVGGTESLPRVDELGFRRLESCFYERCD
jgi:chemotaxis protein methyltransferase CheR